MADKSEELFQSIETIAKGLIDDLKFNKTVICTIKDNKNAKDGKYYVTDGTSNFYAFCENTDYLIDQSVYVLIPNGDYSNQKIITGRYLADENEVYTYKSPLESFVDITGNLFKDAIDLTAQNKSSLIANGLIKEIQLWENEALALKGYTTIGFKANFKTLLSEFNTVSGHYGVKIKIRFINDTTSQTKASSIIRQIEFNNDEMYGNTYNFETYYSQEKIFIISEPNKVIDKIWVTFYQEADFRDASGALIPVAAVDNIFIKDAYLALGYDLNSFGKDQVLLYTLNSSTYDATSTLEENRKILNLRWVHKFEDGNLEYYSEENDEYSSQMRIHWYKYHLATGVKDNLAGNFWEEIEAAKNKFQYVLDPDTRLAEEKIKVIIESPIVEEILKDIDDSEINTAESALEVALAEYNDASTSGDIDRISATSDRYDAALEAYELAASKYSVEAQYYESNILSLTNESMVANYASIDLVSGLNIECDLDGYNGVYTIYNSANELQNQSEAGKLRLLTAVFDSIITGIESLDTAEKITWKIPLTRTMIQMPTDGKEYSIENGDDYIESSDGTYCLITRDGTKAVGDIGSSFPNAADQYFRIKPYFVEQATNNTISCYVTKDNLTYGASITLIFGTSGNSGTDYTFILQWEEGSNCIYSSSAYTEYNLEDKSSFPIRIDARLFDEQNNELTLNTVHFSWLNPGLSNTLENSPITFCNTSGYTIRNQSTTKPVLEYDGSGYCYIHYDNTQSGQGFYNILKAEVTTEDNQEIKSNGEPLGYKVILTAYLPIPLCNNIFITDFEGCNKILYTSLGTNPTYYTGAYKIFQGTKEVHSDWEISIKDSQYDSSAIKSGDSDISLYYPQIESSAGEDLELLYYPIVPSMYFSATGISCAIGSLNNKDTWCQPILIDLDHYQSSMLNSWDGNFTIDEEAGTIMSTMIGAGRKDERNRFSGVLVGDINTNDEGVFGYHEGDQSFGFRTNGQAFIGKAGKGRILFDGNSGAIQSMSYTEGITSTNLMTGMKIDLDDGIIEMHGVANSLSSTAINDSDFRRHYTSTANLSNSEKYISSHSLVKISALSPYFYAGKAIPGSNQITPIFQIGDQQSFIQTLDYSPYEETGARITLSDTSGQIEYLEDGTLSTAVKKESSFEIKAYSSDGAVKVSSSSPFLWAAAMNASSTRVPVLSVGSSEAFLQTVDYNPGNQTGARITLKGQDDTNINNAKPSFEIKAYSSQGAVKLSSISPFLWAAAPNTSSVITPVFYVGSDTSYLQTVDYSSSKKTRARITLKSANDTSTSSTSPSFDIKAYSNTGGIKISSISPYFVAQTKNVSDTNYKTLINVGNESFYLQSANYSPPTSQSCYTSTVLDGETVLIENDNITTSTAISGGRGMRIDLATGKIIGYDFSLKAQDSSNNGYNGSYVSINSNGNSYLRIHLVSTATYKAVRLPVSNEMGEEIFLTGDLNNYYVFNEDTNEYESARNAVWNPDESYYTLTNNSRNLDLLNIGKNKFLLQSQDWQREERNNAGAITQWGSGTQINLVSGKITSYNFNLKAINSDRGVIYINSTNSIYPFRIEGNVDTNAHSGSYSSTATANVGKSFFRIKWTGDFKAGNNTNYLEYSSGRFTLKGGMISGGAINIGDGYFQANDEEVIIGEFESKNTNRGILQSSDECSGMSNFAGKGGLLLWAGWHSESNYQFLVNDNSTRIGGYLYANLVGDSTHYTGTLGQNFNTIYESIWTDWSWLIKNYPSERDQKYPFHSQVCQWD